jgi:hypothetical protein
MKNNNIIHKHTETSPLQCMACPTQLTRCFLSSAFRSSYNFSTVLLFMECVVFLLSCFILSLYCFFCALSSCYTLSSFCALSCGMCLSCALLCFLYALSLYLGFSPNITSKTACPTPTLHPILVFLGNTIHNW